MTQDRAGQLTDGLLAGNRAALARLITWAESLDPRIGGILGRLYPRTGEGYRLGITGPPGAGKSTLISRLALTYRDAGERVSVVAVDPSSPFTGGALLGDRIRMTELSEDPAIFVRSMATRGSLGGLAAATLDALDLLDAAGYRRLIVETVGVGQVELDVAMAADTVVVVLVPESGDGVQAMKAGLMEIGDVFVVNKADRDGADKLAAELEGMLELRPAPPGAWRPPVIAVSALWKSGLDEARDAIDRHRAHMQENGVLLERRRRTMRERVLAESGRVMLERLERHDEPVLDALLDRVLHRELSPHAAARALVDRLAEPS